MLRLWGGIWGFCLHFIPAGKLLARSSAKKKSSALRGAFLLGWNMVPITIGIDSRPIILDDDVVLTGFRYRLPARYRMTDLFPIVRYSSNTCNKKSRSMRSGFGVEYGARTHDLLNHNQAL